jgi:hypothetical protein
MVAKSPFPSPKKSSLPSPNGKCNDFCRRKFHGGMHHAQAPKGAKTFPRPKLLERLSGATKRRDKKKRRDEKGKGTMKKAQ